ncbi:lambda exonuclease family protein [Orrella dioscoreae]|uniref:Phage related protein n=1 Tax=Orrella dioscoreae TaxID=1851544 RepID=A0A1C3K1B7_9BURK|nr:lambda exonuclease family protein [Orrella dioscoreae]SBT25309.1 Phage related protein [Orrella dioscoreae]SOE49090.1 Phage related protein [Orrella dioscoreae]
MQIINCEQGSPEWHAARAGAITASMFKTARTRVNELDERQALYVAYVKAGMTEKEAATKAGYKAAPSAEAVKRALAGEKVGDWSDTAKNYAFRLAVERIAGAPLDEGFETWQMARGHELEPEARMEHEMATGLVVDRAGFVLTDDGLFGASADGLFGEDGGSEYKCFVAPDRLRAFHIDGDASEVMDQVQGCMWITGRKRWHLGLYCPALAPIGKQLWLREFARDDDYIESMVDDLLAFAGLVDSYEQTLRQKAA